MAYRRNLLANEAMGVKVRESVTVDPKPLSRRFIKTYTPSENHYDTMAELLALPSDSHGRADMLVIGSPCAPFSAQRSHRFTSQGF
eukprot:6492097-Amphidinium_carterae.2